MNNLFEQYSLNLGRTICSSKTLYRINNPNSEPIFNANIFAEAEKVWYGDLDLTRDSLFLQAISTEANKKLYILREMDGRFENEKQTKQQLKEKAVKIFNPND